MSFLWRDALWLLLALPLLAGAYVARVRRRPPGRLRYPGLEPIAGSGPRSRWLTHGAAVCFLAALTTLLLAAARPVVHTIGPTQQGTIVLLMDVSLSMAAGDVAPTRLDAARAAAATLVRMQPPDVRIGVVAFGAHADVVQAPTANREDVLGALASLELQRYTAIGNGLIGALLTLIPGAPLAGQYDIFGAGRPPPGAAVAHLKNVRAYVAQPGSYLSAAIVLVSDGRGTMGVPPAQAARAAADLGIRVYTVGVGTLYGGVANVEGWPPIHAEFDEAILQEIAQTTRGEYFLARTGEKLDRIYGKLARRVIFERQEREVTAMFTACAIVLSLAGAALSLWMRGRTR